MSYLPFILISTFIMSIIFSLLSFNLNRPAMDIVNDMGLGWNLGNTFDCYDNDKEINNPEDQITLCGNIEPKRELFTKIKKYGFKSIRFPITWFHFMDNSGKVDSRWMKKVKEVVDWIIEANMYCIINIQNDSEGGNWLSKGIKAKEKFSFLWKQIAEEFIIYDDYLIFESMNDPSFLIDYNYDYKTLNTLNQAFVDAVRSIGGNNANRLLLISGAMGELEKTTSEYFKLPTDPSNKLAISFHFTSPEQFTVETEGDPYFWVGDNGEINIIPPLTQWGSASQYKDLITQFETMKKTFIEKEVPIIINKVYVNTEENKEIESIREYLYIVFCISSSYNGIMPCLWDTSNNGISNYYNRVNDKWIDEEIKNNFKKISKKKFVDPFKFIYYSNIDTEQSSSPKGPIKIQFGSKKVMKVIFNAYIKVTPLYDAGFGVASHDKGGGWVGEGVSGGSGKKQYDGSLTFTLDVSEKDYNEYIQVEIWWGHDFIFLNYLSLEFEKSYPIFDYKGYKENLLDNA